MTTLDEHLAAWSATNDDRRMVARTLAAIASGATALAGVIAHGPLAGGPGGTFSNTDNGDGRQTLALFANSLFIDCLRGAQVAAVASEETAEIVALNQAGQIVVAIDPLDGSGNVEINAPMGTVFSLLPATSGDVPERSFLTEGSQQVAAGFILYGPHTAFVLTLGEGVHIFTLDPRTSTFVLTRAAIRIPLGRREYAINASNGRHWPLAIRAYVEECLAGTEGPRGVDYNTRWLGAIVAEAYRIVVHGGIYLYPGDTRPGYGRGRLRQLYEANPIAMLIEQAGGMATDGYDRVLDLVPAHIHENVPLIFGSSDKVERVIEMYAAGVPQAGQRPLFAVRGLFKS